MTSGPLRIVVTGASRGIGLALSEHLAGDGHRVVGTVRDVGDADGLRQAGVGVVTLDVDRADTLLELPAAVDQHLDGIDVLVNNAGIKCAPGRPWCESAGPLSQIRRAAVLSIISTDLLGPILVTQALRPQLRERGAVVINVSSQLGSLSAGVDVDYAYNAVKAALNMVTVTMARDPDLSGAIPVALNPGWIDTDMTRGDHAPLQLGPATRDIADLIPRLRPEHAGSFIDRFGHTVPW